MRLSKMRMVEYRYSSTRILLIAFHRFFFFYEGVYKLKLFVYKPLQMVYQSLTRFSCTIYNMRNSGEDNILNSLF